MLALNCWLSPPAITNRRNAGFAHDCGVEKLTRIYRHHAGRHLLTLSVLTLAGHQHFFDHSAE